MVNFRIDSIECNALFDPTIDKNQNNSIKSHQIYKTPLLAEFFKVFAENTHLIGTNDNQKEAEKVFKFLLTVNQFGIDPNDQLKNLSFYRADGNTFLANFMNGLQFIDRYDVLHEMAKGDPAPWAAYDSCEDSGENLAKWNNINHSIIIPNTNNSRYNNETPQKIIEKIFCINQKKDKLVFRGHEVIAGGPYDKNGNLLQADTFLGEGYFKATKQQLAVLKSCPLIDVFDVVDFNQQDLFLVRYRYPDIRDIEKLKSHAPKTYQALCNEKARLESQNNENYSRFMLSLTSPATPKIAEEMVRQDSDSPDSFPVEHKEFIHYTKMMIQELFEKIDCPMTPEARYQYLLSLHPFFDMNGRTMRAYYKAETGKPFLLKNWDFDILYTEEELKFELEKNLNQWICIAGEMKNESFNANVEGRIPLFYDTPRIWLTSVGIDPNDYTLEDQKNIVLKLKEIFRSTEFERLNQKKAWFDMNQYISEKLGLELNLFIKQKCIVHSFQKEGPKTIIQKDITRTSNERKWCIVS